MDGDAAVEIDVLEIVVLGYHEGPGGVVGVKVGRAIARHSMQHANRVGRKSVLVGDAAHGFKVVAGLQLPSGNEYAIAWLGRTGWTAGVVVRVRQKRSVLLYQFVGDLVAREFMTSNQSKTVFRCEIPFIVQRKTPDSAVVGVIFPGPPG
jgi:hypothetical protein